ncbi:MAG TPA: AsmA family protein [Pseudolabrys sp.]|nr:AsmA family protein [Pseudolabrys sp.]
MGLALLAVLAVGAGVLTAASYLISPETVRAEVLSQLRIVTGLNPTLRGTTSVTLFPTGGVSFDDVVLGEDNKPALTAERLTAQLRFFPLLTGRVEIADVSLTRPTILVDLDNDGHSNWSGLLDALTRGQAPTAPRTAAFSEMRIKDGTIVVQNPARKLNETFTNVVLSLAWPSISKSFGATGRLVWHDEPLDLTMSLSDFAAALGGNRSGLKVRISGKPLKTAFEGSISVKPTVKIEGNLAADSASLHDTLVWAGQKPLPGGGFGHFALKAKADVVGGTIGLTNVNVDLDGNSAEGVLTFATDGRQTLQGTLAFDKLNLTPYVSTIKLLTANQREWSSGPIMLDGLTGTDFDLRLSAANVVVADTKLGRTAIGANLRAGHLTVTIGEAQAFSGLIKGSVALATVDQGIDLKSQLVFTDVDLNACLGQLFGLKRIEGRGDITFAVDGSGDSVLAVTQTLNGNASLTAHDGKLSGLDVEQLLKRLERRPLSGAGDFRNGRTAYDQLAMTLRIAQGNVTVEDMKITGPAVQLALAGSASIPQRELDLTGTASLVTSDQEGSPAFALPFIVQGSWDDPIMLPDAEALIRRSGAAAPLLDAVRDRRARDAARSVIERLTGHSAGAVPTSEQTPAAAAPK